jgi:ABC-2 type transport system permease protein
MIETARTVAAKELREILSSGGPAGGRRGVLGRIAFPVIFGAFLGYQSGFVRHGFGRAAAVFPMGLIAMGTASTMIVDAVAGERERHTLETLLASPASDIGIIAGKIVAVVVYAWVIGSVGLVAVGVASAFAPAPISPTVLLLISLLALLEAVLAAGFGVQFSLHADSVRAAGRRFGQYAIFMNMIGAAAIGLVVAPASGAVRLGIAAITAIVLLVMDVTLILLARLRFRRSELLLD